MGIVYKNKWLNIKKKNNYYFVDENLDQVAVIPYVNKSFILVKQFRPTLNKNTIEFPAGSFNKNIESPKRAGIRELFEETGIKIKNIHRLKKIKKLSINPQRNTKLPYIFYVKVNKKELLRIRSKSNEEIITVLIIKTNNLLRLIKKGAIMSSFMNGILFSFLLIKKKIIIKY